MTMDSAATSGSVVSSYSAVELAEGPDVVGGDATSDSGELAGRLDAGEEDVGRVDVMESVSEEGERMTWWAEPM